MQKERVRDELSQEILDRLNQALRIEHRVPRFVEAWNASVVGDEVEMPL
jgi:hypothetical protein